MKKWSLLLVLVLLIAAFAITAQAATVPENVEWIELDSKEAFLEWFGNTTKAKHLTENYTAGMTRYYKLTGDITLDQDSTLYYLSSSANEVNTYIDLNGHTLTYASPKETGATRLFGGYNANTTTTVVNGTINNQSNITGSNGGLFLMNKGKLYMEDVVINDKADVAYTVSGKVISAVGYDVTLINVDINTGSTANHNYGLAVRCENATLTMKNCNLTSTATARTANGGLVYQVNGALNITDCTFTGGYGKLGGNVYAKSATVTITGSTFTNGRSVSGGQGGSLACYDGTATITDCTFTGATTTPDFGGCVFLQTSGKVTMKNCDITGGKAKYGGAFYSVNAGLTMENCNISGGVATVDGGNMQIKNGTATLTNVNVTGGKATANGGNISAANSGKLYLKSGTVSGGTAKNGGNIATSIASTNGCSLYFQGMTVTGGTASGNGGNLYVVAAAGYAGKPTVSVSAGVITDGNATGSGGNVYLAGLAKEAATADKAAIAQRLVSFTMTGGTLGGAAPEGKKYACEAETGGNLFAQYATVNISGGEVSNGHAKDIAGNLYTATACTMTISGTAVVSGGIAAARGGNVYMSSTNSVLNIKGGTIKDGHSYNAGGNLYHGNGKLTITGGIITGGKSETSGGNLYAAMGYGNNPLYCGVLTIKDDGNADTPVAQITNGAAIMAGGNIYIACDGNSLETGANKAVLGDFILSGGTLPGSGEGDDLYIKSHTVLEILPEFSQEITCFVGHALNGLVPEKLPGAAFANDRGISTGEFTGKLILENYDDIFVYAKDGTLYFAGAATIAADGTKTWFKTNEEAVAAYGDAAYMQAGGGTLVLPEGAYTVDLAGQNVAITGAATVTLMDSENDDFVGCGSATLEGVTLQNTTLTRVQNKDYYMLAQDGTYTFHRVQAQLTNVALRPAMGGIYYTAKWGCDETLKPMIGTFGIALSMKNFPGTDFANDETALYTTFQAADFECGVQKTGAMIAGILKDAASGATQERVAMNSVYAQMDIFAEAYVTIDGVTYTGMGASYSMYDIMKTVADLLNDYYTQAPILQEFMTQWSGNGLIGEPWDSLNFQVSQDVLQLNSLYAGLQPYYGELHDHAETYGTSDGKQTLDVWKSELSRLKMDFATIVDHKQSSHMYLDEWDNSIFIGGSEAATKITDRTGVNLHYNMIFSDPKGLETVVSTFPEYKWQYYPEDYTGTNAEKLAGGWHFSYPNFTAARFTEVCQAVYDNGGFVAIVHPKSSGYISSKNVEDAYFMDGIGMEVFYTIYSNRDGYKTKANHKLWTDMMKAGYKVYATAGNDEHDMPSDKACSVIYAAERSADAWVKQLRKGQFVAGGVGVRSCMGDTMMGGTTAFEGKRFSFSVGAFHNSLYDPTHTYRADVWDQNGIVFTQELDCTKTTYMAFDANNDSNYYYVEIFDVTDNSMIAIGNPIWNEK